MKKMTILTTIATSAAIYAGAGESSKPNLVLFMADDCSYYDLGCYGNSDSRTPNIDRFATQGMRFTNAFQSASMCSPTRHNLLTGIWPVKTGAYPNHTMANAGTLSIVHHLRPAGYRVALIGKSHVQPKSVFPWDVEVPLTARNEIDFAAVDSFVSDCKQKNQPFCLFVMSNQPHSPWNKGNPSMFDARKIHLPPFYVDTPGTRNDFCRYLAEINYMDQEFGTLLGILDSSRTAGNSVVVYLSEQGNSFPFAKWTCFDVGVHSAAIVRWPGKIKKGSASDAMVEFVDILPTFLDAAGVAAAGPLDGKSFLPVLTGKVQEHKQYTFSLHTTRGIISGSEFYGIRSVADKRYRYIVNLTPEETFRNAETSGKRFQSWLELAKSDTLAHRLTDKYQHRPAIELYDIVKDKYCLTNIAARPENREITERMDQVLKEWMASCGDKGQFTEMEALEHQPKNVKAGKGEE